MKFTFFTIATLLVSAIAVASEVSFPSNNDTIAEPDQEICILSIVPW